MGVSSADKEVTDKKTGNMGSSRKEVRPNVWTRHGLYQEGRSNAR